MGGQNSILDNYDLGSEYSLSTQTQWKLQSAEHLTDETRFSLFTYSKKETCVSNLEFIENSSKFLRKFRHPHILRFVDVKYHDDDVYLVTEHVEPLEFKLKKLSLEEITSGLYNILDSLAFLHNHCKISHNNVSVSSIFVGEDGTWKLGCFDYACPFDQLSPELINKSKNLRSSSSITPEEKDNKMPRKSKYNHARDAYGYGNLVNHITGLTSAEITDYSKSFEKQICKHYMNEDPKKRPQLKSLLEDELFESSFLKIILFLQNLTLHSEEEKSEFFTTLVEKLYSLPPELIATRMLQPLLSRFVLLEPSAVEFLIPDLFTPYKGSLEERQFSPGENNPVLPEDLFVTHMVPEIIKIYRVRDLHIRNVLLAWIPSYVAFIDKPTLKTIILPQVLIGLRDKNDSILESSLHALAYLVSLLGGDAIIGAKRLPIFKEAMPRAKSKAGKSDKIEDSYLNSDSEVNPSPLCDKSNLLRTSLPLKDLNFALKPGFFSSPSDNKGHRLAADESAGVDEVHVTIGTAHMVTDDQKKENEEAEDLEDNQHQEDDDSILDCDTLTEQLKAPLPKTNRRPKCRDATEQFDLLPCASTKGRDKLVSKDGYTFTLIKRRTNVNYWSCVVRDHGHRCPATLIQRGDRLLKGSRDHTHTANPALIYRRKITMEAQSAAVTTNYSASEIVNRILLDQTEEGRKMLNPTLIRRQINRARQKLRESGTDLMELFDSAEVEPVQEIQDVEFTDS